MKRILTRFLFALSAMLVFSLVLAGGVGATHSNGTGPPKDLAAGTGTLLGFGDPMIHVNAQKDSAGNVSGHFFVKYPATSASAFAGLHISGHVSCLTVNVNTAGVGGTVERSNSPTVLVGTEVLLTIIDMGEPGTLDQANWGPFGNAAAACPAFSNNGIPIQQGNYIVHQDPPLELLANLDTILAQFEAAAGDCPYAKGG
jgi:hypothetical protein